MPTLLFSLRQVPDDEADEVRALLREHAIEFYETPASKWGLGAGGLWTRDAEGATRAKTLLTDYQRARADVRAASARPACATARRGRSSMSRGRSRCACSSCCSASRSSSRSARCRGSHYRADYGRARAMSQSCFGSSPTTNMVVPATAKPLRR